MPNVIVTRNDYPDVQSLKRVLNYVMRSEIVGGYGVPPDPRRAFTEMACVKRVFHQLDRVQLKHFFITLSDDEAGYIDDKELMSLGWEASQLFGEYQMIWALHLDSDHVHLHVVMNTTSFLDGHQYSDGLAGFNRLCDLIKKRYPQFPVHLGHTRHYSQEEPFEEADRGIFKEL